MLSLRKTYLIHIDITHSAPKDMTSCEELASQALQSRTPKEAYLPLCLHICSQSAKWTALHKIVPASVEKPSWPAMQLIFRHAASEAACNGISAQDWQDSYLSMHCVGAG